MTGNLPILIEAQQVAVAKSRSNSLIGRGLSSIQSGAYTLAIADRAPHFCKARVEYSVQPEPRQLDVGIAPEVMQAGIKLAIYHIECGARTFAAFAKAMIEDLGDVVKPYPKSWYAAVTLDPRAAGLEGIDNLVTVQAADIHLDSMADLKKAAAEGKPEAQYDLALLLFDMGEEEGAWEWMAIHPS